MLDKNDTAVGLLRKKTIRTCPGGRNDICNDGNNVKKLIYEKKWKTKM